jgi:hypothetical protein
MDIIEKLKEIECNIVSTLIFDFENFDAIESISLNQEDFIDHHNGIVFDIIKNQIGRQTRCFQSSIRTLFLKRSFNSFS